MLRIVLLVCLSALTVQGVDQLLKSRFEDFGFSPYGTDLKLNRERVIGEAGWGIPIDNCTFFGAPLETKLFVSFFFYLKMDIKDKIADQE